MARLELASRDWHTLMFALTPHSHLVWTVGLAREALPKARTPGGWKPRMLPLHHVHILGLVTGLEPAIDCLQDSCSAN